MESEFCSYRDYIRETMYKLQTRVNTKYSEVFKSVQLLKSRHLLISCCWSSLLIIAEKGCLEFLHEGFLSSVQPEQDSVPV